MLRMISPNKPPVDWAAIEHAAQLIRAGKLVAFPTETVYGLGANALDAAAVARIFQVKGRPATSPLIVHVASRSAAEALVAHWPAIAAALAEKFWPGPLTLVLPKQAAIPDIVTAGLPSVGLRVPANPWALALLEAAGVPIAAPSANRFTQLSPTTADHVRKSLGSDVDLILDGGQTDVGIESAVVSLEAAQVLLLRPGTISAEEIEKITGPMSTIVPQEGSAHPSPGMHLRHYCPHTRLTFQIPTVGRGAYLWLTAPEPAERIVQMPSDPVRYAAVLYELLHQLDALKLDWIAVEKPTDSPSWRGILDRLQLACSD